jgi:hypothetical protein
MSELILKATGAGFEGNSYDLRIIENLITNYRQIIDRTLPVSVGHRHLNFTLRHNIKYEVEFRPGCLEILVKLIQSTDKEALGALFCDGGFCITTLIAKLLSEALKIRREVSKFLKEGHPIVLALAIGNNCSNTVETNTGKVIVQNPKSPLVAESTRAPINRIINAIDGKMLESVEIKDNKDGIKLTKDDIEMTESQIESLPEHLDIIGRLDKVCFSTRKGTVVSGNNKFSVTWDDSIRRKIRDFADRNGIIFRAKPVVDQRRLQENTIGFHIVDCGLQQEALNFGR